MDRGIGLFSLPPRILQEIVFHRASLALWSRNQTESMSVQACDDCFQTALLSKASLMRRFFKCLYSAEVVGQETGSRPLRRQVLESPRWRWPPTASMYENAV